MLCAREWTKSWGGVGKGNQVRYNNINQRSAREAGLLGGIYKYEGNGYLCLVSMFYALCRDFALFRGKAAAKVDRIEIAELA